jgi:hypothetical protein
MKWKMINKQTTIFTLVVTYLTNTPASKKKKKTVTVKAFKGKSDISMIILCIPWLVPGYLLKQRYSESFYKIMS